MKFQIAAIVLLLNIFFVACIYEGAGEATSEVSAHFYFRYLADDHSMKAEAQFFEADSAGKKQMIALDGGATFQGSGMGERRIGENIIRYQYENSGSFPEEIKFGCRLEKGTEWTVFPSGMKPVSRFTIPESINKEEGFSLILPDGGLKQGEELVLIFLDPAQQASSLTAGGPTEGNSIFFSSTAVSDLKNGLNTVYLVKKKKEEMSIEPFTALVELEYYSTTTEVEVN